ncbi:MAG TPA: hypothetical protein VNR42_06020 [Solirubrobacteraceae bacterium]|nr:hypothetical protein [Solirubrobacteraceae bacterium]
MSTLLGTARRRSLATVACAMLLTLACLGATSKAIGTAGVSTARTGLSEPSKPVASATLEQCLTAETQAERSATFAGEINAIPGSTRMEMRIEVLERVPGETAYHAVSAPGLRVWSSSAPGVKTYKNLNKVTNLAAPAFYRAAVRFRWLSAKGKLLKAEVLRTRRCEQPAPAGTETETPPASTSNPATTG